MLVEARYTLSETEYWEFARAVDRTTRGIRRLGYALLVLVPFVGLSIDVALGTAEPWWALVVGPPMVLAAFVAMPLLIRWLRRRHFASMPDKNTDINWTISSEKLVVETSGGVYTERPWTSLHRVVETPKGFLIYQDNQAVSWLPFSAFLQADEGPEDFRRLVQAAKLSVEAA